MDQWEKGHLVRWVEIYIVSDFWTNSHLENAISSFQEWNMVGVQSWYGQPYSGVLPDASSSCKVTSLPMTYEIILSDQVMVQSLFPDGVAVYQDGKSPVHTTNII